MKVFSAAMVALMATETYSFQVSTPSSSNTALRMSAYDEQLKQYYGDSAVKPLEYTPEGGSPPNGSSAVVNGAPVPVKSTTQTQSSYSTQPPPQQQQPPQQSRPLVSQQPIPIPPQQFALPQSTVPYQAPPPPVPQPIAPAPAPVVVQEEDDGFNGIVAGGLAFLGLPLWLLASTQFLGNVNTPSATVVPPPPPPIVQQAPPSTLTLPITTSNAVTGTNGVIVMSQPITKQEVRNLFELWNDALKTGSPETVAKRYAKDGVLLPTLSDVPRNDFEGIKDYFVHFLEKKPTGKILEGEIFIGNNWAQDAGKLQILFMWKCL